jgi:hypothetical protein
MRYKQYYNKFRQLLARVNNYRLASFPARIAPYVYVIVCLALDFRKKCRGGTSGRSKTFSAEIREISPIIAMCKIILSFCTYVQHIEIALFTRIIGLTAMGYRANTMLLRHIITLLSAALPHFNNMYNYDDKLQFKIAEHAS